VRSTRSPFSPQVDRTVQRGDLDRLHTRKASLHQELNAPLIPEARQHGAETRWIGSRDQQPSCSDEGTLQRELGPVAAEAAETGFPCHELFARDPNLDPIRQDPSFREFMADLQKRTASLRKALFPDRR